MKNNITEVDRISRKEFYNEFVKPEQPVLIKKQTQGWAARELWNAEYFFIALVV